MICRKARYISCKKTNKQNVEGLFGESVFEYNDAWNIVNFVTLKQCNLATKMWKL